MQSLSRAELPDDVEALKGMIITSGLDDNHATQAKELLNSLTLIGTASNGFMWDSTYATEQVRAAA